MLIYVNGCSHTAENILFRPDSSPFMINSWAGIFMSNFNSNYEFHYSYTAKTENEHVLINEAQNGAGNDYVYHKSLETISKLIQDDKKPDHVIIQWSGPNRRMHCDEEGKPWLVNLYDHTHYYIKFEPMASLHTLHYMFSLQEFLKYYKISYFFIPYFGLDESVKNSSIFKLIDRKRVIDFDMGEAIFSDGAIKYILENNLNRDVQGHPNEKGYEEISKRILLKLSKTISKNMV